MQDAAALTKYMATATTILAIRFERKTDTLVWPAMSLLRIVLSLNSVPTKREITTATATIKK